MVRAVVFVDYENCIDRARTAFRIDDKESGVLELDPVALATRLIDLCPGRTLEELRVYRSVPNARQDIDGFGLAVGQIERWHEDKVTVVRTSELEDAADPRLGGQKSLMVAMAIDLFVMATEDRYDVAVVCSSDLDLVPAVAAVLDHTWKTIETVAWRADLGPSPSLHVSGEQLRCYWFDRSILGDVLNSRHA